MQKHVNLVDLVKSFPTNIFLQNLASMQKRTSPTKFDHLAEKSDKGSISNLSTKALPRRRRLHPRSCRAERPGCGRHAGGGQHSRAQARVVQGNETGKQVAVVVQVGAVHCASDRS